MCSESIEMFIIPIFNLLELLNHTHFRCLYVLMLMSLFHNVIIETKMMMEKSLGIQNFVIMKIKFIHCPHRAIA